MFNNVIKYLLNIWASRIISKYKFRTLMPISF